MKYDISQGLAFSQLALTTRRRRWLRPHCATSLQEIGAVGWKDWGRGRTTHHILLRVRRPVLETQLCPERIEWWWKYLNFYESQFPDKVAKYTFDACLLSESELEWKKWQCWTNPCPRSLVISYTFSTSAETPAALPTSSSSRGHSLLWKPFSDDPGQQNGLMRPDRGHKGNGRFPVVHICTANDV